MRSKCAAATGPVVLDFVNPESFAALFFSTILFLVAVLRELNVCS
jgi:hypothetical protein